MDGLDFLAHSITDCQKQNLQGLKSLEKPHSSSLIKNWPYFTLSFPSVLFTVLLTEASQTHSCIIHCFEQSKRL